MRFVLRSLQPCWKTSSVNENPAYPACQVIIAALCRVCANSPSPHAARSAVSRDIRAAQSSPKLKDLFWTRTSRLFTPSGYHLRSLLCARANSPLPHAAQQRIAATFVAHSLQPSGRIRVLHSGTAIGHDSRVQHSGVALGHRTRVQHLGTALGYSSRARHSRYSTRLQHSGIALGSTSLRCCALCS